jgi:hypothetical protein
MADEPITRENLVRDYVRGVGQTLRDAGQRAADAVRPTRKEPERQVVERYATRSSGQRPTNGRGGRRVAKARTSGRR